jgi:hypothetical protein
MDDKLQIQLGEFKNINSVNVDNFTKLLLENKISDLTEYDIRNILNVTEVFNIERQASETYRIYGGFEYMSILNNMIVDYKYLGDFFYNPLPYTSTLPRKEITDFDVYLVRPYTGYTQILTEQTKYIRKFEVIASNNDFEIINAGFGNNLYGDKKYIFHFNKDFDVSSYFDDFGFPVMELYLFFFYRTSNNGWGNNETMSGTSWSSTIGDSFRYNLSYQTYNVGDIIIGDKIAYSKFSFQQFEEEPQQYYIRTAYRDFGSTTTKYLQWKYNPFIPLRLRYFSNELKRANTGSTSYDQAQSIPFWATNTEGDNYVWREILEQGYIDPLTGDGVDYPFVNGKRYLFSNVVFDVIPDLNHGNTGDVFTQIKFADPSILNYSPTGDIDDIGKPCQ